jgi:outer membrane lipoprotein carrier protein
MHTILRQFAGLITALSIAGALFGQELEEPLKDRALQELSFRLAAAPSMRANVTQLIIESDGGVLEESSILFVMAPPNGFYWETLDPYPELIVTNGETLWNYQPDLEQVVIEDWDNQDMTLAAQLLSGETNELSRSYELQWLKDSDEFRLVPRDLSDPLKLITISFMKTDLASIFLEEKSGKKTAWIFDNVTTDLRLDEDFFTFSIPSNIEVIDNSGG